MVAPHLPPIRRLVVRDCTVTSGTGEAVKSIKSGFVAASLITLLATVASLATGTTASAADLTVPIDTVIVSGVAEGDVVELAVASTDVLGGSTCTLQAVHRGEGAVHAGNRLIVRSGAATTEMADVERVPGATTSGDTALVLGDVVTVELEMGPDEEFDGDIDLEFDCLSATVPAQTQADPASLPVTGRRVDLGLLLGTVLILSGGILVVVGRRPGEPDDITRRRATR